MTARRAKTPVAQNVPLGQWIVRGMLMQLRQRGKWKLALMVDTETLVISALETQTRRKSMDAIQATEAVYDNHAHQVVGQGNGLTDALAKADAFAERWLNENGAALERCACDAMVNRKVSGRVKG